MTRSALSRPGVLWTVIAALSAACLLAWHPWHTTRNQVVVSRYREGYAAGDRAGFKLGLDSGTDLGCEIAARLYLPPDRVQSLSDADSAGTLSRGAWCRALRQ
jgi:hypothetical protein